MSKIGTQLASHGEIASASIAQLLARCDVRPPHPAASARLILRERLAAATLRSERGIYHAPAVAQSTICDVNLGNTSGRATSALVFGLNDFTRLQCAQQCQPHRHMLGSCGMLGNEMG